MKRSARPRHPVDKQKRVQITGTEADRLAKGAALTRIGEDFRMGVLSASEARLRVERLLGKSSGRITVGEVMKRWLPTLPDARRGIYDARWRIHLEPEFAALPVEDCDYDRVGAWHRTRLSLRRPDGSRRYSWNTLKGAWAVLSRAVRWAKEKRLVADVPWGGFSVGLDPNDDGVFKRGYASDIRDVIAILQAALAHDERQHARSGYSDLMARMAFLMLVAARESEGAAVTWDACFIDAAPGESWVALRRAVKSGWRARQPRSACSSESTKGKHANAVRIPELLAEILRGHREYLRRRGWYADKGPVFPASCGKDAGRMRNSAARFLRVDLLREIVRAAGLSNWATWTPHCCRHSFASLEGAGGANLREMMSRLRVRTAAVALTYMHERGSEALAPVFSPLDQAVGLPGPRAPRLPEPGELAVQLAELAAGARGLQSTVALALPPGPQKKSKARGMWDVACDSGWEPGQALPRVIVDGARSAGERARSKALRAGESSESAGKAAKRVRDARVAAFKAQAARLRKKGEVTNGQGRLGEGTQGRKGYDSTCEG